MSCYFDIDIEMLAKPEHLMCTKNMSIIKCKDGKNIGDKIAFSFKDSTNDANIVEFLEFLEPPLPQLPIGLSSKFSSCSSFDITPGSSGRSSPIHITLDRLSFKKPIKPIKVEDNISQTKIMKVEKVQCKS